MLLLVVSERTPLNGGPPPRKGVQSSRRDMFSGPEEPLTRNPSRISSSWVSNSFFSQFVQEFQLSINMNEGETILAKTEISEMMGNMIQ